MKSRPRIKSPPLFKGQRVQLVYDGGRAGEIILPGSQVSEVHFDGERVPRYIVNEFLKPVLDRPRIKRP